MCIMCCINDIEIVTREIHRLFLSCPNTISFIRETEHALRCFDRYTLSDMYGYTLTLAKSISTTKDFTNAVSNIYKKWNLNALCYGVIERHPNKKGLHLHFLLIGQDIHQVKSSSYYLHRTVLNANMTGIMSWINYMFKDKPVKNIFKTLIYEGENEDTQTDTSTPADGQVSTIDYTRD